MYCKKYSLGMSKRKRDPISAISGLDSAVESKPIELFEIFRRPLKAPAANPPT